MKWSPRSKLIKFRGSLKYVFCSAQFLNTYIVQLCVIRTETDGFHCVVVCLQPSPTRPGWRWSTPSKSRVCRKWSASWRRPRTETRSPSQRDTCCRWSGKRVSVSRKNALERKEKNELKNYLRRVSLEKLGVVIAFLYF